MTIAITGAVDLPGRVMIERLKERFAGDQVVALVRSPNEAADLGVPARVFDYAKPKTLAPALAGVDTILLISSSEVGQRIEQHHNVITGSASGRSAILQVVRPVASISVNARA